MSEGRPSCRKNTRCPTPQSGAVRNSLGPAKPCETPSARPCPFFFSSRRRHTSCETVTGVQTCALPISLLAGRRVVELESADLGARASATVRSDERVAQDSEQPRLEIGPGREPGGAGHRARVGLLHEILGVGLASREVARELVEPVQVTERLARQLLMHAGTITPPAPPSPFATREPPKR